MVLRQDVWTHDTCLVCQSMHSTEAEKERHEREETHSNKAIVYDFLSKELSCLTASNKPSFLYQRYYRANAAIAGLDCICELNFSWSKVPFWACTICYVAGKSLESADEHMHSSFHKRNYISEYHPERYATLLKRKEKSARNKQSLLEHEAILELLNASQGLMPPDVYEISERDQQWAYQKLGLAEGEAQASYIAEEISDNHQIVLCYVCGETFMAYLKDEDRLREAWFTHQSTKTHQRCRLMLTLIEEERLGECQGAPSGCEVREENKFERKPGCSEGPAYGPTVGLEFLAMFAGSDESFCQLCFCCVKNTDIADHFSSEYHIQRFMKRESPDKLLNSEYLKLGEVHDLLVYCYEEKPDRLAPKHHKSEGQLPLLLKNYAFPEHRSLVSYNMEEVDLGHNIRAIWCEDCKEYVNITDETAWNIHIFDDPHFEQATKKSLHYISDEGLIRSNNTKLAEFQRSEKPDWLDEYSITLGVLTTQDHCEFGLQHIVNDRLKGKLLCTCCQLESDEADAQMFSSHARSFQHISKAMHSLNKRTMITLAFRFPVVNNRKPMILDYLRHCIVDARQRQQGISVYDPVTAAKLNCIGAVPRELLDLAKLPMEERANWVKERAEGLAAGKALQLVPMNTALRMGKIDVKFLEKDAMVFHCEACAQSFSSTQEQAEAYLTEHMLSRGHWERAKVLDENRFDENCRLATKVSKIAVAPFQQTSVKKVTWKWNDKKASYEFVYAQLGLKDVCERRNFHGSAKPDMFCALCAQCFKANRLDLEQHIRSFAHIFYYMQKHQPNIIPELQAELLNTHLGIVERHKNIRRLFAKALKGCERNPVEHIAIYDFEERECEYADVKRALAEDLDECDVDRRQRPPVEQHSIADFHEPSSVDGEGQELLDLKAIKDYGKRQPRKLEQLLQHYTLVLEAESDGIGLNEECDKLELIKLEKAKKLLLNVVHFDGLVETAEQKQQTATSNGDQTAENVDNSSSRQGQEVVHRSSTLDDDHRPKEGRIVPGPEPVHAIAEADQDQSPQMGPAETRKGTGIEAQEGEAAPEAETGSQNNDKVTRLHPNASAQSHARCGPNRRSDNARHRRRSRSNSSTTHKSVTPPPKPREPIVYTSYAKRLADLKASLLAKGGSKQLLTGDPNLFVFQQRKRQVDRVSDYNIAREATTPMRYSAASTSSNNRDVPPQPDEEYGGFFKYTPAVHSQPQQPGYTQKSVGGIYDPDFLERTYPHLLKKDVSPPRGNLSDLTSERVRQTAATTTRVSPQKTLFSSSHDANASSSTASKRSSNNARSPSKGKRRSKRSREEHSDESDRQIGSRSSSAGSSQSGSGNEEHSSSSSDSNSFELERLAKKQQLRNRLMMEKQQNKEAAKIQMHIPKELPVAPLPAFKLQAIRRKNAQARAAAKQNAGGFPTDSRYYNPAAAIKLEEAEMERRMLQAISPEPDELSSEDSPVKEAQPAQPQQQKLDQLVQQLQPQLGRSSRWNEPPRSKYVLVEGKFVPAESMVPTTVVNLTVKETTTPMTTSAGGQQLPEVGVIDPARQQQQAQQAQQAHNVLSQIAASTAALSARQMSTSSSTSTPITSIPTAVTMATTSMAMGAAQTGTPVMSGVRMAHQQQPTMAGMAPLPGSNLLPANLLGTLTSALGVPSSLPPSAPRPMPPPAHPNQGQFNHPPPFMMPPQFQQPPPIVDRVELVLRNKMEYYRTALERINNIKDFIEFMWREAYDPIPGTDPSLLFNEIAKKRKGLIGAGTLYQIICYGHPELETYYCGMCNHWTTVSEMFMHLRAPMHQLNYMFRNYKMFHRKAMEEQDEQVRDLKLQHFSMRIWELEGCGQCTNRMRVILNDEAIRRIWPDYVNCIDHSWKIMDDEDDIEFLAMNSSGTATGRAPDQGPPPMPMPFPPQQPAEMEQMCTDQPLNQPPNQPADQPNQFLDQSAIRAASASVRASIVAKKLEIGERAGIAPPGLVEIKSERKEEGGEGRVEGDNGKERKEEREKRGERTTTSGRRRSSKSPSRRRSRSRARRHSKSRSRSPKRRSSKGREKERDRDRGGRRRSRSRSGRESKRNNRSRSPKLSEGKEKPRNEGSEKTANPELSTDLNERMAQFLHRIGDSENASKLYWQKLLEEQGGGQQPASSSSEEPAPGISNEKQHTSSSAAPARAVQAVPPTKTALSLADRIAKSGESILRRHQMNEAEMEQMNRALSPERPTVTPLISQEQANRQAQQSAKQMEKQRALDDQKQTKRAIGAIVELNQEFERNGGFLSPEVFFDTCQEFGISPDEVLQIDMLKSTAATFRVDIGPAVVKRMHQRRMQQCGAEKEVERTEHVQPVQQQQQQFNLQSMGVDPSKLRSLDSRMLQAILNKANASAGAAPPNEGRPMDQIPGRSRMDFQDIQLDESLAPGSFTYPSYEEPSSQQQPQGMQDIDSNINRLTYAFSQPPAQQQQVPADSSAEVTLAVQASMRNRMMGPFGREQEERMLLKHPQAHVRQPPRMVQQQQQQAPGPSHSHFQPDFHGDVDFSEDVNITGWPQQQQAPGPSSGASFPPGVQSPAAQQFARHTPPIQRPFNAQPPQQQQQQFHRPPLPPAGGSPYSHFQQSMNAVPPPPCAQPIPPGPQAQLRPPPPMPSTAPAQNPLGRSPQKQVDPSWQRLAMEVGDDWSSLGQLSFDSIFGNTPPRPPPPEGQQQQREGQGKGQNTPAANREKQQQ